MPRSDRDAFWATIPRRGRFYFFAAVFCIFAPAMVLPFHFDDPAPSAVLVMLTASGLIGVCWAAAFTRSMWFLAGALGLQALTTLGFLHLAPEAIWPRVARPSGVGLACLASVIAGYVLFVFFIVTEGRRSIRERAELALAREIHRQLVPSISMRVPGFHVVGWSEPSTEVGGDLVDAVAGPAGLDLSLGDVTGHGVRSGVVMAMLKAALHTARRTSPDISRVLSEVNEVLATLTDDRTFVTFAAVRLEPDGLVRFALTGHLPILHSHAATGAVDRLATPALPLGIVPGEQFSTDTRRCAPGDVLAVLTDGLVEVADAGGRQLGLDRFADLLAAHARLPLDQLSARLLSEVRAHGPQRDDQTLLLVKAE